MGITVKRPEKIVEFCTDLGLQSEWEAAGEDLKTARQREQVDARMTGESKEVRGLKDKIQELENRMLDSVVVFTLRALPRKRWAELEAEHPPREDHEDDKRYGVNVGAFIDAVMVEPGTVASVTYKASGERVEFAPVTDWLPLADEMSNAQWEQFAIPLLLVNRGTVTPGFNRAAWQRTPSSGSK
ncbi:MAG: hypothetical protein K0S70_210 [Microbacterium sp.]|jgi:hypothetical protein|nr:hypothetical protein [Microbacterium sp.]